MTAPRCQALLAGGTGCPRMASRVAQEGNHDPRLICATHYVFKARLYLSEPVDPATLPADLRTAYIRALGQQYDALTNGIHALQRRQVLVWQALLDAQYVAYQAARPEEAAP